MTSQHVIIMGKMWHHNDYAVDANGELFQLHHNMNSTDEWWYWLAMGTEEDWPVGGNTPRQPLKKAVIKIVDKEQHEEVLLQGSPSEEGFDDGGAPPRLG